MQDSAYILYHTLEQRKPFQIDPEEQEVIVSLEENQEKIKTFPEEYANIALAAYDALEYIANRKALHAFCLGLDLGLSLMEELRPEPEM